ncbi:hypothetical protein PtB15_12B268 [Puccinia triticina]|nr:hypothetical protein PtB15_12B268 [Puccinia triticina]
MLLYSCHPTDSSESQRDNNSFLLYLEKCAISTIPMEAGLEWKPMKTYPDSLSSKISLKTLFNQINRHSSKWFDYLALSSKHSNVERGPKQVKFSIRDTTLVNSNG